MGSIDCRQQRPIAISIFPQTLQFPFQNLNGITPQLEQKWHQEEVPRLLPVHSISSTKFFHIGFTIIFSSVPKIILKLKCKFVPTMPHTSFQKMKIWELTWLIA